MLLFLYSLHVNLKIPALIVVGVLIFTPSVSGIAAIKSGATCKKLGAIRIESKKTYICTKEKEVDLAFAEYDRAKTNSFTNAKFFKFTITNPNQCSNSFGISLC